MSKFWRLAAAFAVAAVLLVVSGIYGASYYYTSQHGAGCASCHEMAVHVNGVHGSAHRDLGCMDCHEAGLGTKLRHIRVHLVGDVPEAIRLRDVDGLKMDRIDLIMHIKENPLAATKKWFDNVVAARSYIGPMAVPGGK